MNLIVDIGNSSIKLAVFDKGKQVYSTRVRRLTKRLFYSDILPFRIEKVIISSVKELTQSLPLIPDASIPVHLLSEKSLLPFRVEYETTGTLGPDRIAAVAGAYELFSGKDVLIIDAGTAITYEYLSGHIYKGGTISPGLNMRFKALHKFTGRLPLVNPDPKSSFPGRNTVSAISAGVITGIVYEINEYIRTFEKIHSGSKVILTGGDGFFFKEKIDKQIIYMPDLVMEGLNFILEYNAK